MMWGMFGAARALRPVVVMDDVFGRIVRTRDGCFVVYDERGNRVCRRSTLSQAYVELSALCVERREAAAMLAESTDIDLSEPLVTRRTLREEARAQKAYL